MSWGGRGGSWGGRRAANNSWLNNRPRPAGGGGASAGKGRARGGASFFSGGLVEEIGLSAPQDEPPRSGYCEEPAGKGKGRGRGSASFFVGGDVGAAVESYASTATAVASSLSGLDDALKAARLERLIGHAHAWCEEEGAAHVNEIIEFFDDFAMGLGLTPVEKNRLWSCLNGGSQPTCRRVPQADPTAAVRDALRRAISVRDRALLSDAVGAARGCPQLRNDAAGAALFSEAEALLKQLEHEVWVVRELDEASVCRDATRLRAAINEAQRLFSPSVSAQAVLLLAELDAERVLAEAVAARRLPQLRSALQQAQSIFGDADQRCRSAAQVVRELEAARLVPGLEELLAEVNLERLLPQAGDWCERADARSLADVGMRAQDFAASMSLKNLEQKRLLKVLESTVRTVPGLAELLEETTLGAYQAQATAWCNQHGYQTLADVDRNAEALGALLQLRPLAFKRFKKALTAAAVSISPSLARSVSAVDAQRLQAARAGLSRAMQTRHVAALRSAIEEAEQAGVHQSELEPARAVRAMEMRPHALAELQKAMVSGSAPALRAAIAEAERAGLEAGDLEDVREMLEEMERHSAISQRLQEAVAQQDVEALRWAVEEAESAGIDEAGVLAEARALLAKADETAAAKASNENRVPGLEDALRHAGMASKVATAWEWCEENGAAHMEEVIEFMADFGEALGLSEQETELLLSYIQDPSKEPVAETPQAGESPSTPPATTLAPKAIEVHSEDGPHEEARPVAGRSSAEEADTIESDAAPVDQPCATPEEGEVRSGEDCEQAQEDGGAEDKGDERADSVEAEEDAQLEAQYEARFEERARFDEQALLGDLDQEEDHDHKEDSQAAPASANECHQDEPVDRVSGQAAAAQPQAMESCALPPGLSSRVPGLDQLLVSAGFQGYLKSAADWCEESGAADLDEVKEFFEDFVDGIGLRPDEQQQLLSALDHAIRTGGGSAPSGTSQPTTSAATDTVASANMAAALRALEDRVPGLGDLMRTAGLDRCLVAASKWCEENGAAHLEEVMEFFDDFADGLSLNLAERTELSSLLERAGR